MHKSNGIKNNQSPRQKPPLNNLIKKTWFIIAILIIITAVVTSLFRAITPWAKEYKSEVEHHLSTILGQPVKIETMETGWYWFAPVIKLESVSILDGKKKPIFLDKVMVGFNIFGSLWNWQIQPGILYIDQVHVVFREKDGHWILEGFSNPSSQMNQVSPTFNLQILTWLAQQDKLVIRKVSANFYAKDGELLSFRNINFVLARTGDHYRLRGKAILAQPTSAETAFNFMGNLELDLNDFNKNKGNLYLAANNVIFDQAQVFYPALSRYITGGEGNIELWLDVINSKLTAIQSKINASKLTYQNQLIDSFKANIAWQPNIQGWTFSADHMQVKVNNKVWPENKLMLHYYEPSDAYTVLIKSLLLEDFLAIKTDLYDQTPFLAAKLHGKVTDLELKTQAGNVASLLMRFDQFGWQQYKNIPGIDAISGVIQYQPQEGRLELDSENTHLNLKGYPEQHFSIINAALTWKILEPAIYRVNIERLEINQPNLALSILGVLDSVSMNTLGYTRLNVDFSATHAEKWLALLPAELVTSKLAHWLKKDIKHIDKISGRMVINGKAEDFPFDNTPGEFTVTSNLSGVTLRPNEKWPFINDIEGYLNADKRSLQVDVFQAQVMDLSISNMHLHLDDIGKDKEVLYIDTKVEDQAKKMVDFIAKTPVMDKLALLKKLIIKGSLALGLHLEIPLYAENEDVNVKGKINFDKNTLLINQPFGKIQLKELNGQLEFTNQGVLPTTLQTLAFGSAFNIQINMSQASADHTTIEVSGEAHVDDLQDYLKVSLPSFITGRFNSQIRLIIDHARNALNNMEFTTDLKGTKITLPAPFGKDANDARSLIVKVDLNEETNVKMNYSDLIRANISLAMQSKQIILKSGEVRLGKSHATLDNMPGLQIVGTIDQFDVEQWRKALAPFSSYSDDKAWMKSINYVDIMFNKLIAFKKTINKIAIKFTPRKEGSWRFKIKQQDVIADLLYNTKVNTLSGHFSRLHIPKSEIDDKSSTASSISINPEQIPNLNIRIDDLVFGVLKIGDVTFNTKSSKSLLELTYCKLQSPAYTMNIQGSWRKENKNNKTDIQASLIFNNLAKTLELWAITPVVDASSGEINFKGGWSAPIYAFALSKVNGNMNLTIKHGRITNFSAETEKKLGLGKLLSILSLQTLPRRLTLDFSDLSEKGYSFDIFKGNFSIRNGIMHTQDSYIDGPVAYASMKGELDLVRRLYDVELGISPHIGASLPLVATLAGGPIAGAATWAVGKIINQSMQKVSAYSYKISGPWSEPVVQQISIVKKK